MDNFLQQLTTPVLFVQVPVLLKIRKFVKVYDTAIPSLSSIFAKNILMILVR